MLSLSIFYKNDLDKFFKKTIPLRVKKIKVYKDTLLKGKYDYIILPNTIAETEDIQDFVQKIKKNCKTNTRIVIIYFNFLWKPILNIASSLKLRRKDKKEPNWLSPVDIKNILKLENFEEIKLERRFLFPLGNFISQLPVINYFCLTSCQIFKPVSDKKEYSVSIIIPTRNEAGNIKGILNKISYLGKKTEVIFVEGNSSDNTYEKIEREISNYKGGLKCSLYKQKGKGKGDAVRLGFKKAKNDILMILDADLTVPPSDLKKFYNAISEGHGEFVNGTRLIYPMESQAMRTLNHMGNKFFSVIFSYLLDQKIKDTLCGTKVLFRKDYERIRKIRNEFGDEDPFGDFDLLFGAAKLNLKIVEIPVRYKDRTYGKTNISRFKNGLQLLKMTYVAAKKIKFA